MNFEDVKEGSVYRIQTIWRTNDIFYILFKDKYLKHIICEKIENWESTKISIPWSEITQIEEIKERRDGNE